MCLFVLFSFSTTEMAAAEIDNEVTTKLLTLLNASATKVRKRKRDFDDSLALPPVKKLGGKRIVVPNVQEKRKESEQEPIEAGKEAATANVNVNDEKEAESAYSICPSFSRFGTKVYPSRILGTLYNDLPLSRGTSSHVYSIYKALSTVINCPFSVLGVCLISNPH